MSEEPTTMLSSLGRKEIVLSGEEFQES